MVAVAASTPGPVSPGVWTAALLAVAGVALASLAAGSGGVTAWMHMLLADSARHPLPDGQQAAYGVVLGYALHK
jgi:hypothetical protein